MYLRVALNKESVHYNNPIAYSYIDGPNSEEYYFDQTVADALEKDGFLTEMWDRLDALFDWGDCDFFLPDKCLVFKTWLESRLQKEVNSDIRPVYEVMLDYAEKAIANNTGISFDF